MRFNIIIILLLTSILSFAQEAFEGVVDMTTVNNEIQEKAEIKWYIKNGNHRLEYSGTKAGKSYSYVFLIKQGNNLMQMLSDADGKKVVYDIPQNAITNSVDPGYGSKLEKSDASKLVLGYSAYKIVVDATDKISTVWVSDKSPLSLSDMPSILMTHSVLKTLQENSVSGIPMEITSTNTGGSLLFSQKITSIQKKSVSSDKFEVPAEYQTLQNSMQMQPSSADPLQNSNQKGN